MIMVVPGMAELVVANKASSKYEISRAFSSRYPAHNRERRFNGYDSNGSDNFSIKSEDGEQNQDTSAKEDLACIVHDTTAGS